MDAESSNIRVAHNFGRAGVAWRGVERGTGWTTNMVDLQRVATDIGRNGGVVIDFGAGKGVSDGGAVVMRSDLALALVECRREGTLTGPEELPDGDPANRNTFRW